MRFTSLVLLQCTGCSCCCNNVRAVRVVVIMYGLFVLLLQCTGCSCCCYNVRAVHVVIMYGLFLFIFSRHMLTLYYTLTGGWPPPIHLNFSLFNRDVIGPK
jgi:hypothetical protein